MFNFLLFSLHVLVVISKKGVIIHFAYSLTVDSATSFTGKFPIIYFMLL